MHFRTYFYISKLNEHNLPVIILIISALLIGISKGDTLQNGPISGESWSEAKDIGPLFYSIKQDEGRYENFKTKTITKGQLKHNATGSVVDFKTAIMEELIKCPNKGEKLNGTLVPDMDPKRLLCYTLIQQSVIEANKLKKRKINISIKDGMSVNDKYFKITKYKVRVESRVPPISHEQTMRFELNSLPLKDSTVPKQLDDDLEYPVYGDHLVFAGTSPHQIHCSGDLLQSGSPFEHLDDENVRMTMSELEYFAERFKAETTGNFTFEMPKFVCKVDTSGISLMESAPLLFKDFQLHLSFKISKREKCPKISIFGELKTWPIEGLFGGKILNQEECDPNSPNKSNMTFIVSTGSTFFPSLDSKFERNVIIDTTTPQSLMDHFLTAFSGSVDGKIKDMVTSSLLAMAQSTGVDIEKLSKASGEEVLNDIISEATTLWTSGTSKSLPTEDDTSSKHTEL